MARMRRLNVAAYYATFPKGYPQVEALVRRVRRGRRRTLGRLIEFLQADPYTHGSGYVKQAAWRSLSAVELTPDQRQRLLGVALQYVKVRLSREFFRMCRFVAGIADDDFRATVSELAESPDPRVRHRANLLAAYLQSIRLGDLTRQLSWLDDGERRRRRRGHPPMSPGERATIRDDRANVLEALQKERDRISRQAAR